MGSFDPLLNLLSAKFGWLPAVLGWMAAIRIPLKFVSARIQKNLTERMVAAAVSGDLQDDRDFETLLSWMPYRILNFTLDLLFSFKLPTHADFVRLLNPKPPVAP